MQPGLFGRLDRLFSLGSDSAIGLVQPAQAVFVFLYFLFLFFTKINFRFGNLQKYIPATPLPGGRDLAARLPAAGGYLQKKDENKLQTGPWEPAARQLGGRPPRPPGCGAAGIFFSPFREIISHMCHFSNFLQK